MRTSSSTKGRISRGPRAQFSPMLSGLIWLTEFQNASTVWPVRVRPERSVMVPEIITGTRPPAASNASSMAASAALAFKVSKMVSTSSTSTPPSSRASTWAR